MMPAREGKVSAEWAISMANSTSERSPATMTMPPSMRRVSTFSIDMPAMTTPSASRCSSAGSPLIRVPSHAAMREETFGAVSNGSSGIAQTGIGSLLSRLWADAALSAATISSSLSGWARFATTPTTWACAASSSCMARPKTWRSSSALRLPLSSDCPPSTSRTGAPRFAAMRALYESSVGLPTSV